MTMQPAADIDVADDELIQIRGADLRDLLNAAPDPNRRATFIRLLTMTVSLRDDLRANLGTLPAEERTAITAVLTASYLLATAYQRRTEESA